MKTPDYAKIARLEREIYGETFEHIGAPPGASNRALTFINPMVSAYTNIEAQVAQAKALEIMDLEPKTGRRG